MSYTSNANNSFGFDPKFYVVKKADLSAVSLNSIATVLTPTTGKKYRLLGGIISSSAAANILFEDNAAGTTVFRTPKLVADTPFSFNLIDFGATYLSPTANNVLKGTASTNASVTGTLFYTEE